jgi:hypothetical protein
MPARDWWKIAAFGISLYLVSLWREDAALWLGGATVLVLVLRNPDAITNPFGHK